MWHKITSTYRLFTLFVLFILTACSQNTPAKPPTNITPTDLDAPCCTEDDSTGNKNVILEASVTQSEALAGEIQTFPLVLVSDIESSPDIKMTLETSEGTTWKAALCFEDNCFMHDGLVKLERSLIVQTGDRLNLEIKIFVPPTAQSGEEKTVVVGASSAENPSAATYINLHTGVP